MLPVFDNRSNPQQFLYWVLLKVTWMDKWCCNLFYSLKLYASHPIRFNLGPHNYCVKKLTITVLCQISWSILVVTWSHVLHCIPTSSYFQKNIDRDCGNFESPYSYEKTAPYEELTVSWGKVKSMCRWTERFPNKSVMFDFHQRTIFYCSQPMLKVKILIS